MVYPGDVQAAVDRLAADVGHSVLVEDAAHQPLWWSVQDSIDGTRLRTFLQRTVEPAAAAMLRQINLAEARGPVRTPAVPEIDMRERWCVPLRAGRELLGYLWVLDADGTLGQAKLPALVECAHAAASWLAHARLTASDSDLERAGLIDRLLRGPDETAARDLARLEHLPHDARVQVQALPAARGGWPLPIGMSAHAGGRALEVATSGPPLPLVQLGEAVRRASVTRRAQAAGARLGLPSWDSLGAWRLITEASDDLAVSDVHPGAELLASRPRADLMVTARTVLDLGGDVSAAAEELHIHRTTLYYRLDRIAELIGLDLRAGAGRADLQLALWLAAYRLAPAD